MEIATRDDLSVIQAIYHEAADRAHRSGGFIDWPKPFPLERIEQYYEDDSLYKFTEDGQIVATMRMYENCSEQIWQDVHEANALYLGKIATSDSVSGRGYMLNRILPEAVDVASQRGYDYVRFDSLATNEKQMKLYEKSMFSRVGEATIRSINNGDTILLAKWQYAV